MIVGGGLAGTTLAKDLSAKLDHSKYNLVVVEARPYLIWMLGGVRMAVSNEKDAMNDYFFNYDKFFPAGKGTVKKAKVEKIVPNSGGTGGELELTGGEVLPYRSTRILSLVPQFFDSLSGPRFAVLVLATGSKWAGPVDYPESDADIRQFVSQWQQRFKSAENVVIVGGGAVGLGEQKISLLHYTLG